MVVLLSELFGGYSEDEWWWDAELPRNCIRRSMFDPRRFRPLPPPSGLKIPYVDTVTNARIKQYLSKNILQIANDTIFPAGDFELPNSKRKRFYSVSPPGKSKDPERSMEESRRRAKAKVRDIALCNRFTHMFTWTLDPELINRYDSKEVYAKVRSFLSNASQRKDFRYVCIPEYHAKKEGEERSAIHMHGLCMLGNVRIEVSIADNGLPRTDRYGRTIYNMADWKLGFSTCVPLDDNYDRAVSYVTKYITKSESKIFGKWYLSSRSLVKGPDIVPLEPVLYGAYRDTEAIARGAQVETTVFRDVKILTEEYDKKGRLLY